MPNHTIAIDAIIDHMKVSHIADERAITQIFSLLDLEIDKILDDYGIPNTNYTAVSSVMREMYTGFFENYSGDPDISRFYKRSTDEEDFMVQVALARSKTELYLKHSLPNLHNHGSIRGSWVEGISMHIGKIPEEYMHKYLP